MDEQSPRSIRCPRSNKVVHYYETLIFAAYYAPRGRQRLYMVASELSQRYLYPTDLIVGIIGAEGAGKSTLIKGLFPGLELTNDDDGVNLQPTPLFNFTPGDYFAPHTFHIDVRYELAFQQRYEIVEAITNARVARPARGDRTLRPDLRRAGLQRADHLRHRRGDHGGAAQRVRPVSRRHQGRRREDHQVPPHGPFGRRHHRLRAATRLQLPHARPPLRRQARIRDQLPHEAGHRSGRTGGQGARHHPAGPAHHRVRRERNRRRATTCCPAPEPASMSSAPAKSRTSGWCGNSATTRSSRSTC